MIDKLMGNQVPFYKISRRQISIKDMEGLFKVNCTHFRNFFYFFFWLSWHIFSRNHNSHLGTFNINFPVH